MPWLFLLLALAAFAVALNASSVTLVVVSLLVALAATVAWVLGLLAQRVGNQARDDSMMLDPVELRRLREEAEARRAATAEGPAAAGHGAAAGAALASGASAGPSDPAQS